MQAVIFDMDGVIVDSERYWLENQREILETAVDADVDQHTLTGMNVLDQYDHLAEEYDISITRDEYFELYDEKAENVYRDRVELMAGFTELLERLQEHEVTTAIASSSFTHWIGMVLDRFDLRDRFDAVVSAEDIDGEAKPAPTIYLEAADQLGVPPEDCIVVEDSAHGITAANRAGMYCIGFLARHNDRDDLEQADEVVETPDELRETLTSLVSA